MNREIKFKGKRTDNGKWVYGNYNYTFERGYLSHGYDDVPPRCYYIDTETNYYEVIPETVGQFTGLKDKNGKEIYEGDILKDEFDRKFYVYWVSNEARFAIRQKNRKSEYFMVINHLKIEVIGNIHENPELLEVANGQH